MTQCFGGRPRSTATTGHRQVAAQRQSSAAGIRRGRWETDAQECVPPANVSRKSFIMYYLGNPSALTSA